MTPNPHNPAPDPLTIGNRAGRDISEGEPPSHETQHPAAVYALPDAERAAQAERIAAAVEHAARRRQAEEPQGTLL